MKYEKYNIAQINIAKLKYPLTDNRVQDFVNNLDRINYIAETSLGFVWRLKDETGNAISIKIFDDPLLIVNMSVWESIDDLFNYTYRSDHIDIFRRRGEWFEFLNSPHVVLWWTPKHNIPTPLEGKEKLEFLAKNGVTPLAFTFKKQFTPVDMENYLLNLS